MGDEPSHCITTKLELLLDNDQHIAFVYIYGPHDVCRPADQSSTVSFQTFLPRLVIALIVVDSLRVVALIVPRFYFTTDLQSVLDIHGLNNMSIQPPAIHFILVVSLTSLSVALILPT